MCTVPHEQEVSVKSAHLYNRQDTQKPKSHLPPARNVRQAFPIGRPLPFEELFIAVRSQGPMTIPYIGTE